MMLWLCSVYIIVIEWLCFTSSLINDYVALEVPLIYDHKIDPENIFRLNYSELHNWETIVGEYALQRGIPVDAFVDSIRPLLKQKQYDLNNSQNKDSITSHDAIQSMLSPLQELLTKDSLSDYFLSIRTDSPLMKNPAGKSTIDDLLHSVNTFHQTIPDFLLKKSHLIIYQSLGVSTGGTTAMNILYLALIKLGFNVVLCNESNKLSTECSRPSNNAVVITGEWCHEVLDEYLNPKITPSENDVIEFLGRGVQYYLGFHHNNDICTGRIAIADSHYVSKLIGRRQLSAYYLGCPMTSYSLKAFEDILNSIDSSNVDSVQHIEKENLIVIDPDYNRDYPPEVPMNFELPEGYKMIYAQEIPAQQMPLLLQRAKITLDLGMPGPERLSGEAILSGAIPIISERMNGASQLDFVGITRVNPYNGSEISEVIERIAKNHKEELMKRHNIQFMQYILSLQTKLAHTSNTVFGSSVIHFIVSSHDLQTEYIMNFQILSLLYLYPLCSIDIYVLDVKHFMRHHYVFMDILKQSGYIRVDPLIPEDFPHWKTESGGKAFLNIKSISTLETGLNEIKQILNSSEERFIESLGSLNLIPDWLPVTVLLKSNVVLRHPNTLFDWLNGITSNSDYKLILSDTFESDSNCEANGSNSIALIFGPDSTLSSFLIDLILSLTNESGSSGQCTSPFDHSQVASVGSVTSVCALLKHPSEQVEIVDSITDSIPWKMIETFSNELGFRKCFN